MLAKASHYRNSMKTICFFSLKYFFVFIVFAAFSSFASYGKESESSCDFSGIRKVLSKYDIRDLKIFDTGLFLSIPYDDRILNLVFFFQAGKLITFQTLVPVHPMIEIDKKFMEKLFKKLSLLKNVRCSALHVKQYETGSILKSMAPDGMHWEGNPCAGIVKNAVKLREQGALDQSTALLEENLKKYPENNLIRGNLASNYLYKGDMEKNAELIMKAIKIWEDLVAEKENVQGTLSELYPAYLKYESLTKNTDLKTEFLKRYEKNHSDAVAVFMLGVFGYYDAKYSDSIKYLEELLPMIDKESRVFLYLAMNNFRLKNQEKALEFIEKAISQNREDPDVYYCRSLIVREKNPKQAISDLENYLKLSEVPGRMIYKEKHQWIKKELESLKEGKKPKSWDERDQ
jgi:tetratricopeptide (TPR) repeat protein